MATQLFNPQVRMKKVMKIGKRCQRHHSSLFDFGVALLAKASSGGSVEFPEDILNKAFYLIARILQVV